MVSDNGSTHTNILDFRTVGQAIELAACLRGACTVTIKSKSLTYTAASWFVCTSPLAVMTVVGFLDTRTVYSYAEFRSLLLSMCIDALELTINSLSCGSIQDGEGRHQTSEGEKNVAVCSFFAWRL